MKSKIRIQSLYSLSIIMNPTIVHQHRSLVNSAPVVN